MTMHCPKCGCERPVSSDVVDNQPVMRCCVCGRRLAAGAVLPQSERIQGFTPRERYRPVALDGVSRAKYSKRMRSGLTLVELIVLLAVIAILMMVLILMHVIGGNRCLTSS
jgi:hypothetical protein